jgi:hypothetical protein
MPSLGPVLEPETSIFSFLYCVRFHEPFLQHLESSSLEEIPVVPQRVILIRKGLI